MPSKKSSAQPKPDSTLSEPLPRPIALPEVEPGFREDGTWRGYSMMELFGYEPDA